MRNLVVFVAILAVVGILGYYIIQWFRIPEPALLIFGILLLAGLVVGAFGYWRSGRSDPL